MRSLEISKEDIYDSVRVEEEREWRAGPSVVTRYVPGDGDYRNSSAARVSVKIVTDRLSCPLAHPTKERGYQVATSAIVASFE